jgi:hypothetical protein
MEYICIGSPMPPTLTDVGSEGESMISLATDGSLRIDARGSGVRIACESGEIWVTRAGDLRDLFLRRGDFVELDAGSIIATALEPAVIDVTQFATHPWIERLIGMLSALQAIRIQWFIMCRSRVQKLHAFPVPPTVCDAIRQDPSAAFDAEQSVGARPCAARRLAAGGGAGGSR